MNGHDYELLLINSCANFGLDGFGRKAAHAGNIRFSDIWADEWKSRLHIAIQVQSRLTVTQMNF